MRDINKKAIKHSKENGPIFGAEDIQLKKNLREGMCYADGSCNFSSNNQIELLGDSGSSKSFVTKELEVFKVNY